MEMSAYDRLYDVCEANGYQLEYLVYEYARKRNMGSKYDPGRIGLRVVTFDEEGVRTALGSWAQSHGSTLTLEDLAVQGLNYLNKKKYIS
jgi:hypothetical protein